MITIIFLLLCSIKGVNYIFNKYTYFILAIMTMPFPYSMRAKMAAGIKQFLYIE